MLPQLLSFCNSVYISFDLHLTFYLLLTFNFILTSFNLNLLLLDFFQWFLLFSHIIAVFLLIFPLFLFILFLSCMKVCIHLPSILPVVRSFILHVSLPIFFAYLPQGWFWKPMIFSSLKLWEYFFCFTFQNVSYLFP